MFYIWQPYMLFNIYDQLSILFFFARLEFCSHLCQQVLKVHIHMYIYRILVSITSVTVTNILHLATVFVLSYLWSLKYSFFAVILVFAYADDGLHDSHKYLTFCNYIWSFTSVITYVFFVCHTYLFSFFFVSFMIISFEIVHTSIYTLYVWLKSFK